MKKRPLPDAVFTPRAHQLNDEMYIIRKPLQDRLVKAINGTKNILIRGESGSGKTWLYKKVFKDTNAEHIIINLANAVMSGGVAKAIEERLGQNQIPIKTKEERTTTLGARPMNIGAEHVNKSEWRTYSPSPFHQICTILRTRAASRHAVLVFENFEQICQKPDLVSEIASILVLCDDDAIASKNIRVLIVGASDEMRKLISAYPNATTIANRLLELPEVSRLSITDSKALLRRGLVEKLGLAFDGSEDELLSRIAFTADGTAQHIHEIGLHVANQAIETASKISSGIVRQAERDWINESLTTDVNIIESQMNSKSTKIGRKNQVLYALGQTESDTFSANDVEDLIRQIFNGSNEDQKINAGAIMAEFSKAVNPLIKKSASGEAYRFVSPKYRTCLRIMLDLDEAGRVQKSHSGGLF